MKRCARRLHGALGLLPAALAALLAQAADAPAPAPDPAAAAQAVFRNPEYWWKSVQVVETPKLAVPHLGWLGSIFDWLGKGFGWLSGQLGRLLDFLLPFLGHAAGAGAGAAGLLPCLVWLGLGIALLYFLLRWRELWRWVRPGPAGPAAQPVDTRSEGLPDAGRLMNDALAALGRGDSAAAIRSAFLAVIAHLQSKNLIPSNRARTNRQHGEALRASAAAGFAPLFGTLALTYEKVCYGKQAAPADDARAFVSRCQSLVADSGAAA